MAETKKNLIDISIQDKLEAPNLSKPSSSSSFLSSQDAKEVKVLRIIKLPEITSSKYSNESNCYGYPDQWQEATWIFFSRTKEKDDNQCEWLHYNQFAIIEIEGKEHVARWHLACKRWTNPLHPNFNKIYLLGNYYGENDIGKNFDYFLTQKAKGFVDLIEKQFLIPNKLIQKLKTISLKSEHKKQPSWWLSHWTANPTLEGNDAGWFFNNIESWDLDFELIINDIVLNNVPERVGEGRDSFFDGREIKKPTSTSRNSETTKPTENTGTNDNSDTSSGNENDDNKPKIRPLETREQTDYFDWKKDYADTELPLTLDDTLREKVYIRYRPYWIYTKTDDQKQRRSWQSVAKTVLTFGLSDAMFPKSPYYSKSHFLVDNSFGSDFICRREEDKNPQSLWNTEVPAGCYIVPYIAKIEKVKNNKKLGRVQKQSADEGGNFTGHIKKKDNIFLVDIQNHSKHYLERHCYYNFKLMNKDYARMWGVRLIPRTDKYGFLWDINFTNPEGEVASPAWQMLITLRDENVELLTYNCSVVENIKMGGKESSGALRWLLGTAINVGVAYATAGAVNAATTGIISGIGRITGQNAEMSAKIGELYDSGKEWALQKEYSEAKATTPEAQAEIKKMVEAKITADKNWRTEVAGLKDKQFEDRLELREENREASILASAKKTNIKTFSRTAGQSFRGLTRLTDGGGGSSAHYTSGIADYLNKQVALPIFQVEVRTSRHWDTSWNRKLNWHISNFFFPFGDDPEICLEQNIGFRIGSGKEVLSGRHEDGSPYLTASGVELPVHGWIQLASETWFEAMTNPLIDYWVGTAIFIKKKCCNKYPHEPNCQRPRLTPDKFYIGYVSQINKILADQEGMKWSENFTSTKTKIVKHENKLGEGYIFAGFWTGTKDGSIEYPVEGRGVFQHKGQGVKNWTNVQNAVSGRDTYSHGVATGSIGDPECYAYEPKHPSWEGQYAEKIKPFLKHKYHKIYWEQPKTDCTFEFGRNKSEVCITRFLRDKEPEEQIHYKTASDPTQQWWELRVKADGKIDNLYLCGQEVFEVEGKLNRDFNPLKIQHTVQVESFSGIESWGNNPPDGFSGSSDSGVMGVNAPNFERVASAVSGMPLANANPLGLDQRTTMPESISSALDLNLTMPNITLPPMNVAELMRQHNSVMVQNSEQQHTIIADLHREATKTPSERVKTKKVTAK